MGASGRGVVRTSTIFISTRQMTDVYESLDDMPEDLRRQLLETTSGRNAATILIADRKGREEILRAYQRRQVKSGTAERWLGLTLHLRRWVEILLPGAVGLAAWILFTYCR